jgi:hypothetical protein
VTVSAPPGGTLQALRFGAAQSARPDAGDQGGSGPYTVALSAGTQQTAFTVTRVTARQGVDVPVTVADACGDWPTFVGGGPAAV